MATATDRAGDRRITKADLTQKLQGLQDGLNARVERKRSTLIALAAGGVVVVLLLAFVLGKRSGKKKRTVVEIRRL